jgi:hypothetical protein
MIHVENLEVRSVAVSWEMFGRIYAVYTFFKHARVNPSSAMIAAHGVALLSDYFSTKSRGNSIFSCRGEIPVPFSLAKIRQDMREEKVGYYTFNGLAPEVLAVLKQLKRKTGMKREEDVALLGIGLLSDFVERFVSGERIVFGRMHGEISNYDSETFRDYRPVLFN